MKGLATIRFIPPLLLMLCTAGVFAGTGASSVVNSPHNLSASGPGLIHASDEDRVCIFCHTPHGSRSEAPLWNRKDSNASYMPYDSPTLLAHPGQPTGSSKLCLSCHDGTVGLGDLVSLSSPITMSGPPVITSGGSLIGTDLRDDHPISFPYSESLAGTSGDLAPPQSWDPAIRLDNSGMLQCTTCHDSHDNQWGKFLVMGNSQARLCRECHTIADFDESPHATSSATWSGSGLNPWPHTEFTSVAENACMNCHRSHHAPGNEELLNYARNEDVCLNCHNGTVATGDVAASFRKPFRHPVAETSGAHQPGEIPTGFADHVTCVDCHNPHKAIERDAAPPYVPGVLEGVTGMSSGGTPVDEATYEYEVCFKCHSQDNTSGINSIQRQSGRHNVLREFASGGPSYHPVVSPGVSPDVPSLIAPLNTDSMITCSDCHGDNSAPTNTSASPAGPHGSNFRFILKLDYQTTDGTAESPTVYALCYSCHDRASILSNQSFKGHRQHIVDRATACSVCHDAHGIDGTTGNAVNNSRLMNFDRSVVQPLPSSGLLEYSSGSGSPQCTLTCHNSAHDARAY